MIALLAAVVAAQSLPSNGMVSLTDSQLRAYSAVSEVARQTCGPRNADGHVVNVDGKAGAALNIDKVRQALGSARISIAGGISTSKWSGPLQRDVGAALVSRTACIQKSFEAMVLRLPLTDTTTGKAVPRPPSAAQAYRAANVAGQRATAPQTASGNTNTAGQQIASTAPATNIQIGGPTGTGSVTQNNYLTPVTVDQKRQAREALLTDLSELARYPERGNVELGPSLVQHHFRYKAPRALYILLEKYNHSTIAEVPNGDKLNAFEASYYDFESKTPTFEQGALAKIGAKVPQKTPYAWQIYYEYCINRSAGLAQKSIISETGDMNYGITPEQAELIYQQITTDPDVGPGLTVEGQAIGLFTNLTTELLAGFRDS